MDSKVIARQLATMACLDRFILSTIDSIFKQIKYIAADKVLFACSTDNSLPSFDIRIYDSYMRIISSYRAFADVYLNSKAEAPAAVKDIWAGVYSVLMSRLITEREKRQGDDEQNPLLIEKKEIVSRAIRACSNEFDALFEGFIQRPSQFITAEFTNAIKGGLSYDDFNGLLDAILSKLVHELLPHIHSSYIRNTKAALEDLNNLTDRHDTAYYLSLLKTEHEILRQIVKVQILPLEQEGIPIIEEAVNHLKEAYQREAKEVYELDTLFDEVSFKGRGQHGRDIPALEGEDELADALLSITPFDEPQALYEELKYNFARHFKAFVEQVQKSVTEGLTDRLLRMDKEQLYHAMKELSENRSISLDIIACFKAIVLSPPPQLPEGDAVELQIIQGIVETIEIKVDSIKDALANYGQEAEAALEDMGVKAQGHREALSDKAVELAKAADLQGPPIAIDLSGYITKHEAFWTKQRDNFAKQHMLYKKDMLFFELTTFEEVVHYSVSRLRESVNGEVLNFVDLIDGQIKALDMVMVKYGIEKLRPAPHEPFNAKEHEVLMAEVQEGFKKGEIIKTMNSGYRHKGVLVLRANIIAAR